MDSTSLLISMFLNTIGFGYFLYGKRATHTVAMGAGVGLMVFPYLVTDSLSMSLIGIVLMALPFAADRLGW